MNAALVTLAAAIGIVLWPSQQAARDRPNPSGTAAIAGRVVVNDAAAAPIRRAFVELRGGSLPGPLATTTGDDGAFSFDGLAAGRYTLEAWRNNFVRDVYGSRRPGGTTIVVGDAERESIVVRLTRSAVITGRISGDTGGVGGLPVVAARVETIAGQRRFGTNAVASSDDRGVYRIYGLAPGEYVVASGPKAMNPYRTVTPDEIVWATTRPGAPAPPMGALLNATAPVYYPGTFDPAAATSVVIAAGEERTGIDIASMFAPATKIDGVFVGPQGQPILAGEVQISTEALSLVQTLRTVRLTPDGRFASTIAAPGRYTLVAHGVVRPARDVDSPTLSVPDASGADLWGALEIVAAGQDLTGLVVPMLPGARVFGRVVMDGRPATPEDVSRVSISIRSADAAPGAAAGMLRAVTARDDGTFAIGGIAPGRARISVSGGTVKSISIGSRDVADVPFDVRPGQTIDDVTVMLTERTQELAGRLIDASGRSASEYVIVVFPVDASLWGAAVRRTTHVRPDSSGRFTIATLPEGEYFVCALEDLDPVELQNAALFRELAGASARVTLREGQRSVQDLQIARERLR
jgi:hypothetical protein